MTKELEQGEQKALTEYKRERDILAAAIAGAAQKAGIYNGTVPLTGPDLIKLCEDLASRSSVIEALTAALEELVNSPVEFEDRRINYLTVQVDKRTIEAARAALSQVKEPNEQNHPTLTPVGQRNRL